MNIIYGTLNESLGIIEAHFSIKDKRLKLNQDEINFIYQKLKEIYENKYTYIDLIARNELKIYNSYHKNKSKLTQPEKEKWCYDWCIDKGALWPSTKMWNNAMAAYETEVRPEEQKQR